MQQLLLSSPTALLPAIIKDSASMFQLGLTDEANAPAALSLQAPDHTCFLRAYSFNASPINGSVRSAIMQSTPLPYYYILCAQMQVIFSPRVTLNSPDTCTEHYQTQRLARAVVDVLQRTRPQRAVHILAAAQLVDSCHVVQQNVQYCGSPRQWQDHATAVLCQARCIVARAGDHLRNCLCNRHRTSATTSLACASSLTIPSLVPATR
jgi:hypothetical protein